MSEAISGDRIAAASIPHIASLMRATEREHCDAPCPHLARAARGHHAGIAEIRAAARTIVVGAGAPTDLARGVRGRLLQRVRRLDHPALQDLRHLPGLYRARPARHDPPVPRHAIVAVDGL